MADDFSLNTVIKVDTTNFDKGIKKVGKSVSGVSDSVSTLGKTLGKAFAITSFAVVAKKIGDISKEFSKATANIVKGTGATGDALKDLADSVNNAMLNGVGRSADEVGEMVADLNTRLGVTGDTLETLVDKFDAFSSVTNTDVNTAINTTADIMAKWNIDTEQAGALLDQLVVASQSSGASVDQLAGSLKSGQAILSQFGMSLTESLAFLSSLKKNGIETSIALTGMRTALANFSAEGKDAEKAFAEVSEKIKNASTNAEALQIAVETFGSRSGAEMVKVLQSGEEGVEAFTVALENAGGALAKTDEASRTSQDALEDLQATLKATFFTGGGDTQLRDTIDSIAKALRDIDFSGLKESFTTLGSFIKGSWGQFKQFFTLLGTNIDTVSGYFQTFADNVYAHFNTLYQNLQTFVVGFKALMSGDWQTLWDSAKLIVLRTVKLIVDAINNAIKSMPNLFNSVINGYNKILEAQDKLFIEVFHLPEKYFKSVKLPTYKGEDLIDTTDIEATIKDVATKIENRTGETVTYTLKELDKVQSKTSDTTGEIVGEIGDIGDEAEETGEKVEKALDPTTTNIIKAWEDTFKEIQKDADDWSDVLGTVKSELGTIANEAFTAIGESLVNGESGWANYGAVAMEALAGVLQGIGAQLTAMAVAYALSDQYAKATVAMAGATAVMVASGTMTALAQSSGEVAENLSSSVFSLEDFRDTLAEIGSNTSSVFEVFENIKDYNEQIASLKEQISDKTMAYLLSKMVADFYGGDLSRVNATIRQNIQEYEDLQTALTEALQELEDAYTSFNDELEEGIELNNDYIASFKTFYSALSDSSSIFSDIVKNLHLTEISNELLDIYEDLTKAGLTIGETLVDSIIEGASKEDFLSAMKDYLKENIVKLAVYTDTFNEKLADIGSRMAQAIVQGADLTSIRKELEELYDEASANAEIALASLSEVFSDIGEEAEESVDDISDYLEELEALIADFETEVGGIGTDIADSLISGLADGLTNSDFLETMYSYIRKLIIQTVVYTESMQSEIEAIGEAISKGLSDGFSTDSLATIRRDLSYIFYNASKQMTGIDSLLESVFSGYATGTQSATRGLHLVGEAGPELVAFKGGETVYNAGQTRTMLGNASAGSSFNVTFNNTSDTSAYTMMKQLRQYDRELKLNGVI